MNKENEVTFKVLFIKKNYDRTKKQIDSIFYDKKDSKEQELEKKTADLLMKLLKEKNGIEIKRSI